MEPGFLEEGFYWAKMDVWIEGFPEYQPIYIVFDEELKENRIQIWVLGYEYTFNLAESPVIEVLEKITRV
jgi:hypothetical protein